ncbi:hypothetical protein [Janthinobacterium lividum]|uniref:hypothetical protein n=1 Tax=Janthinobacterium lividum TaxID=29581 RepID=UPI0005588EA7|nr:hypothetical protein [Janthinobacterium lividum]
MTINFGFLKTRRARYVMLALTIITALVATGFNQELGKSDWAAWVQAVGSIAAIIGSFFFGRTQSDRDRENALHIALAANREKWATVKAIVDNLYHQCRAVAPGFDEPEEEFGNIAFVLSYNKEQFARALQLVESIPIFELNSDRLARYVIDFQRDARKLGGFVDYAKEFNEGRVHDEGVNAQNIKTTANEVVIALHEGYEEIASIVGLPGMGRAPVGPAPRI